MKTYSRLVKNEKIIDFVALVGGFLYLIQSWFYAHHQLSVLDEGAYLMKGYYFVIGRYTPFQDFGPLTNHMPLSFVIPGIVQSWFGPGLLTGRYFSIFLGLWMLAGVYALVRRWKGAGWATLMVWGISLNIAVVKMYSVGVSQVLVACLLAWILFFSLDGERPKWSLMVAAALAGVLALTRINMTPVIVLLIFYIYWQYGRSTAIWAAGVGGLVVLTGHIIYWPGIFKLWANWLPRDLTPFLDTFRVASDVVPRWTQDMNLSIRFSSVLLGLRSHSLSFFVLIGCWFVPIKRNKWKHKNDYKAFVFLLSLFVLLVAIHLFATVAGDYCVFCFQNYMAFYAFLGMLLVVLIFSNLRENQPGWAKAGAFGTAALFFFGIGMAAKNTAIFQLPRLWISKLLEIELFKPSSGMVKLKVLIQNSYGVDYAGAYAILHVWLRTALPVFIGLLLISFVFLLTWVISKRNRALPFWRYLLNISFLTTLLLSPSVFGGGGFKDYDCEFDVIASYEKLGEEVAGIFEPEDLVYWVGGESAVPILYMNQVEIFPPQLNNGYSYRLGGDTHNLVRLGYWNAEINDTWQEDADYLLVEETYGIDDYLENGWVLVAVTSPADYCREAAGIQILLNTKK